MKRHLRPIIVFLVSLMLVFQLPFVVEKASASSYIGVYINGQPLSFDQPPIIESGRTLVPMRVIFEALGADVKWVAKSQTIKVIKGDISINLQINKKDVLINGETIPLDVPTKIVNSRTLVPLRFISETLGATVEWKAKKDLYLLGWMGFQ